MKTRLALLFTLIFSVASVAPSFAAGERYALVIGNAKYPDAEAPLKEPINDARDIADELKRDGFNVEIGENLTGEQMRRAFERLYGKIKPGSVALIFYSGFGVQSSRQSYMIPVDALNGRRSFGALDVAQRGVDHVDILFNAGHPSVPKPHYHVILWYVSARRAADLAK